jgi:hypothetical protein
MWSLFQYVFRGKDLVVADEVSFYCGFVALEIGMYKAAAVAARRCFPGERFPLILLILAVSRREKHPDFRVHFYE